MEQRNLIPVALAVLAAGGTLWWVSTRPAVDPLEVGGPHEPATAAPGPTPPQADVPPPPLPPSEMER
ncbi:MAG: hypothetical protein ACYTGX_15970, partial [Planctomycetota bacterium]